MPIKKYHAFLRRSHKKINELKRKLQTLSWKNEALETEEKVLKKIAEKPVQEVRVVLSMESVFKAAFVILMIIGLVFLLSYIKSIIIIFLVALFLSAAFSPAVDRLQKNHIPRPLGILIMYIIVLGIIVVIFTSLIPIVAEQITALAFSVRDMIYGLVNGTNPDSWFMSKIQPIANEIWQNVDQTQVITTATNTLKEIGSGLTNFAGNAIGAIFTIFNGLFNLMIVLIITFFMVVNQRNTSDFFQSLFPERYSGYITLKTKEVSRRIGEWIRGQALLAIAMGILTFIVFSIIGLHYSLTLAMVSAMAEFIPYLGPLITFASTALIALNQDPILLLWLIPAYAVIQFTEGNIMVPLIIGKSVGMNPIIILFSLLAGATIGIRIGDGSFALGLVGMIIAVPVANIISIFVEDYTGKHK